MASLPLPLPPEKLPTSDDQIADIVDTLVGYKKEAEENRRSGLNPRDAKWSQNLDLYWGRHDFSGKADWQSQNVMPEVPSYVDRFAAALKEALVATPNGFYTVTDPYDSENNMANSIKSMTDVWLTTMGANPSGTPLDFMTVFEEQVKLGSLMAMSGVVMWKDDVPGGRVAFETVDPRQIWLDHTYRNLYRIRSTEVDLADISRMMGEKTAKGKPLFDIEQLGHLTMEVLNEQKAQLAALTGNGQQITSDRKPITLDEYIATVVGPDGKLLMDRQLAVVAKDKYLIRGPENNPFWHKQDWMVYAPLMASPLSPYGRSYMEDFGDVAKVYTDLTNLILDAAYTSSMNAYAIVPGMLLDPTQANTGIHPNKVFNLEEGFRAEDFAKALDLGSLDAGAVQVWQALKAELSEAAGMNEIGLGQLPNKSHIAATAVAGAQQSSSAVLRSVAQTIETRFLDPVLNLTWKTGLQHVSANDPFMQRAVGPEMYASIIANRKEMISRPMTFQARGISMLIQRQQRLQQVLSIMQIVAQNENLTAAFMQAVSIEKLLNLLFQLSNVDLQKLAPSERDKLLAQAAQPLQQAGQRGTPTAPGQAAMGDLATQMGVAR